MTIRVTNMTNSKILLSEPIGLPILPRETKVYDWVIYDDVVNEPEIYRLLQVDKIRIDNLDDAGQDVIFESLWDEQPHLILDPFVFWVDGTGDLRIHVGEPESEFDGSVVGGASGPYLVSGLDTSGMSLKQAAYVDSVNNKVLPTDCSAATGTFQSATFSGVYIGPPGSLLIDSVADVQFDSLAELGGSPPVAGQTATLSWVNNGQFRNDVPPPGSKNFATVAGVILDTTNYAVDQRCRVLLREMAPVKRQ